MEVRLVFQFNLGRVITAYCESLSELRFQRKRRVLFEVRLVGAGLETNFLPFRIAVYVHRIEANELIAQWGVQRDLS